MHGLGTARFHSLLSKLASDTIDILLHSNFPSKNVEARLLIFPLKINFFVTQDHTSQKQFRTEISQGIVPFLKFSNYPLFLIKNEPSGIKHKLSIFQTEKQKFST